MALTAFTGIIAIMGLGLLIAIMGILLTLAGSPLGFPLGMAGTIIVFIGFAIFLAGVVCQVQGGSAPACFP